MRITAAIDSFKGSLDSVSAGRALSEGIKRVYKDAEIIVRPVADGGEGTVDTLVNGTGGIFEDVTVTGPLGEKITARYGIIEENTAVVEMSAAAGLLQSVVGLIMVLSMNFLVKKIDPEKSLF